MSASLQAGGQGVPYGKRDGKSRFLREIGLPAGRQGFGTARKAFVYDEYFSRRFVNGVSMKPINGKRKRRNWKQFAKFIEMPSVPFQVRQCATRVELMGGSPRIFLTRRAFDTMYQIVDLSDVEIGWLGTVARRGNDFFIDEIFLFKQTVSAAETDISTEGLAEVGDEILRSRPDGMDVCNNLRFWGHSHVRFDTRPSSTDDEQMEKLRESDHPWFIRGIFNKLGKAEFTIFMYDIGVTILDAQWSVIEDVDDGLREEIKAEIALKAKPKVYVLPASVASGEKDDLAERARNHGFTLLSEVEAGDPTP